MTFSRLVSSALLLALTLSLADSATAQPVQSPFLCDYRNIATGPDEFRIAEGACIARSGKNISRDGDKLTVRSTNGRMREFVGNRAACESSPVGDCRGFSFLGYIEPSNTLVVAGHCYEFCADTYLINATDGSEIPLAWSPSISPDGKTFLAILPADVETNTTGKFPTVELYELGPKWLVKRLAISDPSPRAYASWNVREWVGTDIVDLTVSAHGPGCTFIESAPYKIIKIAGSWRVFPELPCK